MLQGARLVQMRMPHALEEKACRNQAPDENLAFQIYMIC